MFKVTTLTNSAPTSPKASVQVMTIDELDKLSHCPEMVDEDSWKILCRLRREKIASERRIATLATELAETEEVSLSRFTPYLY